MAAPPLATVNELARRLGRSLSAEETLRAEAAIADASALVRAEAGMTWTDDNGDLTTVPDIVGTVVLAVAQRRFDNPAGYISETQGPFSYRLAGGDEAAGMFLTPGERRLVRGLGGGAGFVSVPLKSANVDPVDLTVLPTP